MVTDRFVRSLVFSLCAFAGFAVVLPDTGAAQGTVAPVLKCVRYHTEAEQNNQLEAFFGYISTLSAGVTIDVGENNFFSPGIIDRGQPTILQPGLHEEVFSTAFQLSGSQTQITWFLNGHTITAKNDPRLYCDPPRYRGAWNSTTGYVNNDLVEFNGSLWQHTGQGTVLGPFSNNQPGTTAPGLTQSHWTVWNGLRLGLSQDGQGTQGPPGPQGPQGPQGPAGNPNIFPSSQIFTFPNTGVVTITDPNVQPASLIVLQYVGGRGGESDLVVHTVGTGQFAARGGNGRQFRYVVFN
jgi:hypothetical protein